MNVNVDYFVQITFVLLILSMITEKTANWIKLRVPDNQVKRFFVRDLGMFAKKGEKEDEGDRRTREIQTLTFVIGLVVALACRANLFKIYDPEFALSWFELPEDYVLIDAVSDIVGCFLTGIFLSLGSKFFHDLLGLLMETKNLKRKLKERQSIENLHTKEEFDTYIAEVEPVVIEKELEKYIETLHGVDHFEYSDMDYSADIFITDEMDQKLKESLSVKMANKTTKNVELNYIFV